jgi:hypothetical protein
MSVQYEVVDNVLEALNREGILQHLIIVGSWCTYFYRHHYGEIFRVSPLRTLDIDINVSRLRRAKSQTDIPALLAPLGFDYQSHRDGSMSLIHPAIKIEFLVPEKGRGAEGPLTLKGFRITAQPLRFLSLLEEDVLGVEYRGMTVNVPSPAHFAFHKLVISQRRWKKGEKPPRDIRQALEVLDMLFRMGEGQKTAGLGATLTKKQRGYITQALKTLTARDRVEFEALEPIFREFLP